MALHSESWSRCAASREDALAEEDGRQSLAVPSKADRLILEQLANSVSNPGGAGGAVFLGKLSTRVVQQGTRVQEESEVSEGATAGEEVDDR